MEGLAKIGVFTSTAFAYFATIIGVGVICYGLYLIFGPKDPDNHPEYGPSLIFGGLLFIGIGWGAWYISTSSKTMAAITGFDSIM